MNFVFFAKNIIFAVYSENFLKTMTADCKYDVFISYSRKDYVDENKKVIPGNIVSQIKEAFDANKITYWMDEDGIYSGDEFAKIIAKIIRQSKILLFISTQNSNASEWTSDEIATARMYKKKIIPFKYDDSFYNEEIIIFIAKLDFVDYQANPEQAINKLVSSIKKYLADLEEQKRHEEELLLKKKQEEEERRRKEMEAEAERQRKLEEEKLKKQVKKEIKQLAIDHRLLSAQQEVIEQQLLEKNLIIGNDTKACPVCKLQNSIGASYCEQCGFQFPTLYALDGSKSYPFDEDQLAKATSAWTDRGTAQLKELETLLQEKEKLLLTKDAELMKKTEEHKKELEKKTGELKKALRDKEVETDQLKETIIKLRSEPRVEMPQPKEPQKAKLPKTSQQYPEGAIGGVFSVGPQAKAYFSRSNLLFNTRINTWCFAGKQFFMPSAAELNQYTGELKDLFNNNATDWGSNPILHGGNTPHLWRTPTKEEWDYLFEKRETLNQIRFAKAMVNGVNGVILFPDHWDSSTPIQNPNKTKADFSSNIIAEHVWDKLFESKGAVFLPAAGFIKDGSLKYRNLYGYYWASPDSVKKDYYLYFYGRHLATHNYDPSLARSVRLIYPIK